MMFSSLGVRPKIKGKLAFFFSFLHTGLLAYHLEAWKLHP